MRRLLFLLNVFALVACITAPSRPTPTETPFVTPTLLPSNTPTQTPFPTSTPTAIITPPALQTLDARTQILFGDPASTVLDFFHEIQMAIETDDKEKFASLIYYPVGVHSIDGKDADISNQEEFIANYDKIVTEKFRKVVLSQDPFELSTSWRGVMVNRGELYYGPICLDGSACLDVKYYIYGSIINDTPW